VNYLAVKHARGKRFEQHARARDTAAAHSVIAV